MERGNRRSAQPVLLDSSRTIKFNRGYRSLQVTFQQDRCRPSDLPSNFQQPGAEVQSLPEADLFFRTIYHYITLTNYDSAHTVQRVLDGIRNHKYFQYAIETHTNRLPHYHTCLLSYEPDFPAIIPSKHYWSIMFHYLIYLDSELPIQMQKYLCHHLRSVVADLVLTLRQGQ